MTELHGQFTLRTMLLLDNSSRILCSLLSIVEVVTAATCRLTLHKVVLCRHALTDRASRRGLLRAKNNPGTISIDDCWELASIKGSSVNKVELGASRAFTTLVLGVGSVRWSRLFGSCGLFLRRTDTLIHHQIVLIDMQRYALDVRGNA